MEKEQKITASLSPQDTCALLEIIDACVHCRTTKELRLIFKKLKPLMGINGATINYFNIEAALKLDVASIKSLNISLPQDFMGQYMRKKLYYQDIPVLAFLSTFEIINWRESVEIYNAGCPTALEEELAGYGFIDGWIYGTSDPNGVKSTIMSFASESIDNTPRSRAIIELITPHLSEAYKRALNVRALKKYHLTPRETEVLNWLKEGKTSWEISQILKISERGVNFHIDNLKTKLNSVNRIQAVAVALGKNLISL
jgi:DNA-binding CsgD family transcriptional regulator